MAATNVVFPTPGGPSSKRGLWICSALSRRRALDLGPEDIQGGKGERWKGQEGIVEGKRIDRKEMVICTYLEWGLEKWKVTGREQNYVIRRRGISTHAHPHPTHTPMHITACHMQVLPSCGTTTASDVVRIVTPGATRLYGTCSSITWGPVRINTQ